MKIDQLWNKFFHLLIKWTLFRRKCIWPILWDPLLIPNWRKADKEFVKAKVKKNLKRRKIKVKTDIGSSIFKEGPLEVAEKHKTLQNRSKNRKDNLKQSKFLLQKNHKNRKTWRKMNHRKSQRCKSTQTTEAIHSIYKQ